MKKIYGLLSILLPALLLMQLIRPGKISNVPAKDLAGIPVEVNDIIRKACYDCHSSETNLHWYDKVTPANFLVASHIDKGRAAFNFSGFDSLATVQQNAALFYALNKVLSNEMPLPSYTLIHPGAKLQPEDIRLLKDYLRSRTTRKTADRQAIDKAKPGNGWSATAGHPTVASTINGIDYISNWRNWTAISTTDRFDNGSVRIIYGNDIAVKAIQSKQTNPFPDGAILAKAAWRQQTGKDSIVSAGAFYQVEFMIKDAGKYAATDGWGWARWRGDDLKPYGKDASFVRECTTCHRPVKDNDYVFTQPLSLTSFLHSK